MAITYVQSLGTGSEVNTADDTLTHTLPAGTSAGNFLVAVVGWSSNSVVTSVTDPRSNAWTVSITGQDGASGLSILWCVPTTPHQASDVLTFNSAGSVGQNKASTMAEFSGVVTSSPSDTSGTGPNGAGGTANLTSSTLNTTNANDLVIAGWCQNAGTGYTFVETDWTATAPWTKLAPAGDAKGTGSHKIAYSVYQITSATGSYQGAMTAGATAGYATASEAYKEAVVAAGAPDIYVVTSPLRAT